MARRVRDAPLSRILQNLIISLRYEITERVKAVTYGQVFGGEFWFTKKEKHFFDRDETYKKKMGWYVKHFPACPKGGAQPDQRAQVAIDATQGYVKTPSSPGRILESYGEAARKIAFVFFVRNPTDRAWSHYFHKKKCCLGEKTFEQWVDEQLEACAACRLARPDAPLWPDCDPKTDDNANALVTGLYVQQLRHWLRYFAAEQFLIVPYAGFVAHPSEAVRAIVGKAGIEFKQTWEPSAMKRKNAKTPGDQTLDLALRAKIDDFFAPYNAELRAFLKRHDFEIAPDIEKYGIDMLAPRL